MKRDFTQKTFAVKRSSSPLTTRGRWILLGVSIGLFLIGIALYFFLKLFNVANLPGHYSDVKTWVSEGQNHLHQTLVSVQNLATKKPDAEQTIHFEFYTTLPDRQMVVAEQVAKVSSQPLMKNNDPTYADRVKPTGVPSKEVISPFSIANAQELEQELADRLHQMNYTVQLGVFRTQTAAQTYRQTLIYAGFKATIVVLDKGKKPIYRLQLGPYADKKQAKSAQQQLERQGLKSLILTSNL
jgi:cell division protein FtsN